MAVFGMFGSGSFVANEDPQSWRQGILRLYPNADTPLVGITSMLPSEAINNKKHNWWTKVFQNPSGTVTGVYTDSGLATAYTSGATSGTYLYIKMAEAIAAQFLERSQVVLRDASDLLVDVTAKVEVVVRNGASSYLKVLLLEADDNSASHDLSDCDTILNLGTVYGEGSGAGQSKLLQPTPFENYMHIHKTPIRATGSVVNYDTRTEEPWAQYQQEGLLDHATQLERMIQFSEVSTFSEDGQPAYTARGIMPFMRAYNSANIIDYRTVTTYGGFDFSGKTWAESGELFMDAVMAEYSIYASGNEILALAGARAIMGLNRIAKQNGVLNLAPTDSDYGLKFQRWINPHNMDILMKSYAHYSIDPSYRNSILLMVPQNLKLLFKKGVVNSKTGATGVRDGVIMEQVQNNDQDSRLDLALTEWTLELGHAEQYIVLHGIGENNQN